MSDNRRRFSRLGIICTILKKRENIHGRVLRVVKLETEAFNFAKSNNSQWVFPWYQIVQSITMNLILIIALSAVSCNLAQRKLGSQKKQNARKSIFSYLGGAKK